MRHLSSFCQKIRIRKCAGRAPPPKGAADTQLVDAHLDGKHAWSAAGVKQMRPKATAAGSPFLTIGRNWQVPPIVSTIWATEQFQPIMSKSSADSPPARARAN